MRILGLDIEPGKSPLSSSQPTYSIVIIDDDKLVDKEEGVKLSRLIRLAWEYKPDVIALDNVFELGQNEREVARVLSLFPPNTRVVQVTLEEGKFEDLREVAKKYSIDVQGKPRAIKTALLNALLALRGAGTQVTLFEAKTKIVISKGKGTSKGGMSSNRYKRGIRGAVLRVARKVKEALDSRGFDYDYMLKRSKAGIEKAVFIVYAPRESLYGLVRSIKTQKVTVEVKPVYKSKLIFGEERTGKKLLIVGVDPGIETGVAILDVYGNPVYLVSRRSLDRLDIIEIIRKFGKPVVIATDVNPPNDAVKKLSGQLGGVKLYIPERSLSIEEKTELVQKFSEEYGIKVDDPHIRDSLAAALKAFHEISKKVNQALSITRKLDLEIDEENLISCIISGKTVSDCVEAQIERELETPRVEIREGNQQSTRPCEPPVELIRELESLKQKVKTLTREKIALEERINELKTFYKVEVMRDRKVYELSERLNELTKIVNDLRASLESERNLRSTLEDLVLGLREGRFALIKSGESDLIDVIDGRVYVLGEEVNPRFLGYVGKNFIIIDKSVLKELDVLRKEKVASRKKEMNVDDVKRIVEEYRKTRRA